MHSCLYEGRVWHRRHRPVAHEFQYRLFMAYLDLEELSELVPALLPARRGAGLSFQPEVHLTQRGGSLTDRVADVVRERTGRRPSGPIRLLTQLRSFGYYFSPLNLFYCFDETGEGLESVLAEVSNTPWGEQHYYVLWEGNRCDAGNRCVYRHAKQFHVSPFMSMDADYAWHLSRPGRSLAVRIDNQKDSGVFFEAGLVLRRRPLNAGTLRQMSRRYPWMTARIMAAIYYEALRLWMKRCPYYPHPKKQQAIAARPH